MAVNFEKAEALALIEGATGANKFKLADEQKSGIMSFFKERSYSSAYGAGLPVSSVTKGSVTYVMNSGAMTPVAKSGIGAGALPVETTGFKSKTVYLSAPQKISGGFEEADLMAGMEDAVATKYAQALNTFNTWEEREFIKAVAVKGTNVLLDPSAITTLDLAKAAKNTLVDGAFEVAEIVDPNYAIDGIEESRVFIDLSSVLFNRLVDERLISDAADATFKEGIFRIGQLGGFAVRRNEFLGKAGILDSAGDVVHAIIATDITAVSPKALVAANAGQIGDLSEDKGYYVEKKVASVDGSALSHAVMGVETLLKTFGPKA